MLLLKVYSYMCLLNIVTSWEYLENNTVSGDMILGFDNLLYIMNNSIVGTLLIFLVLTQYKILLLLLCLSYSNDLVYAPRRLSIPRHTSHQWKVRTPTLWLERYLFTSVMSSSRFSRFKERDDEYRSSRSHGEYLLRCLCDQDSYPRHNPEYTLNTRYTHINARLKTCSWNCSTQKEENVELHLWRRRSWQSFAPR